MPRNVKAPAHGATGAFGVGLGGSEHPQDKPNPPAPQVADLIRSAKEAARAHLIRGLTGEGADAFAAVSLGLHHARRAERLATFGEARP